MCSLTTRTCPQLPTSRSQVWLVRQWRPLRYLLWILSVARMHGLRTPIEGINQRNLKFWANVADEICFGRSYEFGIGIWFSAKQWRRFPHRASVVRARMCLEFLAISVLKAPSTEIRTFHESNYGLLVCFMYKKPCLCVHGMSSR